ncbi:MAG: hypothetical protein JEY97_05420 [Bacteroidales bacterium]|nr:hypothetical protein [Bacteroidales bacterium]
MKNLYKNYLLIICLLILSILSIKLNAQHFIFEGGDATEPVWTIYFQEIILGVVDLEEGDEIAVFDNSTMVGVFTLTQVCTPENCTENVLPAFSVLNSGPGYTPGNQVLFKCWDASLGIESESYSIVFEDPYGDAWTQSVFPPGDGLYSYVKINFEMPSQSYNLAPGYQLMSSNFIFQDSNMLNIAGGILDNLDFIRNTAGYMLRKIGPNWVNSIGDWVTTEGYIFKMNGSDELTISGIAIDHQKPIYLSSGYQIISYLPESEVNALDAFETIIGDNLDFIRNSDGGMLRKIGPNWVNGIGNCNPGEGYLVRMLAEDILIYPFKDCGDMFYDTRNEQFYNTVLIGEQCWMAENLNIGEKINFPENDMTNNGIIEKYCYNNDPANCVTYGGLYQWNEMMEYTTTSGEQGICPDGWHLPSDDEWEILEGEVDDQFSFGDPEWDQEDWRGYDAGKNLKSTTGWTENTGNDAFGFTALPGGSTGFNDFLNVGNWWSSSEKISANSNAFKRKLNYYLDQIGRFDNNKEHGFSVRCLNDDYNAVPLIPSSPNPVDEGINQSIEVELSWTCVDPEGDPLTYDIYFGTEDIPPLITSGQTETIYDPGTLANNTEYFWKIIAHDDHNNTTQGPVWSFCTVGYCGEAFTDPRNGQTYYTVIIGEQCWLAENLNIGEMINGSENMTDNGIIEKYCLENTPANCEIYGGLYQWNEMMEYTTTPGTQGICPSGWHLPTDEDWCTLTQFIDPTVDCNEFGWSGIDVAIKMKNTYGWSNGNGTNSSGFSALPGNMRELDGSFPYPYQSYSWSSSGEGSDGIHRDLIFNSNLIDRDIDTKHRGMSVRCINLENINNLPNPPSDPLPEDGAENQLTEVVLSWTCTDPEGDPLTYDVYFGTGATPPMVATGQTETTFDPGTLDHNTEYFWKIVAHDNHIEDSTEGPVWSFTTWTGCGNLFCDPRDGQTYNTVLIGGLCWMKENLNIGDMINGSLSQNNNGDIEKYCYDNDPINCETLGGLYQWWEMMQYSSGLQGICPAGWHIPTDDEWKILEGTVDSQYPVDNPIWNNGGFRGYDAGKNLKSITGWNQNSGTDAFDFTALPGGFRDNGGYFYNNGNSGNFWSSTSVNYSNKWCRELQGYSDQVGRLEKNRVLGYSVRCLKNGYNMSPLPPSSPNPEDGAINQLNEVDLSWTCTDPEGDPLTYDIYFGTEATPPLVSTGQTETTYDPGTLVENYTEYFWKIVAHDDQNNTTEGPVWNFITKGGPCPGTPTITYGGQVYNTVLIGDQCWMAENLNIGEMINGTEEMTNNSVIEKYCYNNDAANCETYGGLYQWDEMMEYTTNPGAQGICPYGWHLPALYEWGSLCNYLGSLSVAGGKMKESGATHWSPPNTGATNESWFTALAGGYRVNGNFTSFHSYAYFWSSSEEGNTSAFRYQLSNNNIEVVRLLHNKDFGSSVRCIKD